MVPLSKIISKQYGTLKAGCKLIELNSLDFIFGLKG